MDTKARSYLFCCLLIGMIAIGQKAFCQSSSLIEEHFKALNAHDVKLLSSEYIDDAQIFSPNWDGAKVGPAGITETYGRYYKTTPDLSYKINNIINAGDNVIVEYSWTGTMTKPEPGEPTYMEGKKYTLQGCVIFVIKNNKIVKETNYFDQVSFLRQVGFFDQH